ncbi:MULTISPECIES: hypothetical protein [unclassified Streptomyces]|uniref:hypothetical protein n=1 Tax=unclassified Streptomyces TaxID=2593676 RepID=UPI002E375457|nr:MULTISPECIES: hypothetical protein [unclassified Streptomyces]WUC68119.1 hypothetical protein OG861_29905 [Streptomyces sp. NBC_00539]
MTESGKTTNNSSSSGSSSNGTKARSQAAGAARQGAKAASDAANGTAGVFTALPAPLAEKTAAAAQALRGSVGRAGWIWTAIRARKAIAAGAATAGAAAVTTAYTLGRRSGLRRRGPLTRLTGGRI